MLLLQPVAESHASPSSTSAKAETAYHAQLPVAKVTMSVFVPSAMAATAVKAHHVQLAVAKGTLSVFVPGGLEIFAKLEANFSHVLKPSAIHLFARTDSEIKKRYPWRKGAGVQDTWARRASGSLAQAPQPDLLRVPAAKQQHPLPPPPVIIIILFYYYCHRTSAAGRVRVARLAGGSRRSGGRLGLSTELRDTSMALEANSDGRSPSRR